MHISTATSLAAATMSNVTVMDAGVGGQPDSDGGGGDASDASYPLSFQVIPPS